MIDHFGLLAPFYDRVIKSDDVRVLIALADLPTDGILLDAGGGTGRITQALDGLFGSSIVADLSMRMLYQARSKRLVAACSCTEDLPFRDESCDRIIMVDAFHHVKNQQNTAGELWRVLAPGGRIVIQEPDIDLLTVKLLALAEKALLMRSYFLSAKQLKNLFCHENASTSISNSKNTMYVVVEKTDKYS